MLLTFNENKYNNRHILSIKRNYIKILANLRKIENKLILSKLSKNGLQYSTKNSINIIIYW